MAFIEPLEGTYHQKVMRVVSSIMSCFERMRTRCKDIARGGPNEWGTTVVLHGSPRPNIRLGASVGGERPELMGTYEFWPSQVPERSPESTLSASIRR
jgi:hypothetical protein